MACKAVPSIDHARFWFALIDSMVNLFIGSIPICRSDMWWDIFTQIWQYKHVQSVSHQMLDGVLQAALQRKSNVGRMPHDLIAFVRFVYQSAHNKQPPSTCSEYEQPVASVLTSVACQRLLMALTFGQLSLTDGLHTRGPEVFCPLLLQCLQSGWWK